MEVHFLPAAGTKQRHDSQGIDVKRRQHVIRRYTPAPAQFLASTVRTAATSVYRYGFYLNVYAVALKVNSKS